VRHGFVGQGDELLVPLFFWFLLFFPQDGAKLGEEDVLLNFHEHFSLPIVARDGLNSDRERLLAEVVGG
jgi:hypothetical protein